METKSERGQAQTTIIFVGALVVIAAIAVVLFSSSSNDAELAATNEFSNEALPINNDSVVAEEVSNPVDEGNMSAKTELEGDLETMNDTVDEMPEVDDEVVVAAAPTAQPGTYTKYDPSLLANANTGDVLLFFHAKWCPSCRTLENDIKQNLSEIPSDVTILVVDFDTAQDLRQKYGVTRQHTLVQVDANGNEVRKLTGLTNSLSQVVGQL